jgi:hypothetical protein
MISWWRLSIWELGEKDQAVNQIAVIVMVIRVVAVESAKLSPVTTQERWRSDAPQTVAKVRLLCEI